VNGERADVLRDLARRIGHSFSDLALLDRALTHASLANETLEPEVVDNEPLEFLGDAVLGMLVTDALHRRNPDGAEGEKSRRRAQLVSSTSLARHAADLGLPELLRLGRGEEKTGGREKTALWANAFEAIVAAVYLDGGFEAARAFVRATFAPVLENGEGDLEDSKSALQELLQARGRPLPRYSVIAEEGPSHRRRFRVECRLEDGTVTAGEDFSKKAAQQQAARAALDGLRAVH
jgi:ribonuclease-3